MHIRAIVLIILASFIAGCPAIKAQPLDGRHKTGIPFYVPKPFLVVSYNFVGTKTTETTTKKPDGTIVTEKVVEPITATATSKHYSYQWLYLPDLRQKYGLSISSGMGDADAKVTLEDGWKLTSIGVTLKSKAAENIEALGSLIPAVAGVLDVPPGVNVTDPAALVIYEFEVVDGKLAFREVFRGSPFQQMQ